MAKLSPDENWRRHILERFVAFKQSGELKRLRAEGKTILGDVLGNKKLLTSEDWWKTSSQRTSSLEYRAWGEKCGVVGKRYGLAPWTVTMACLLKGYRPEEDRLVMAADWAQVRVVTNNSDPVFVARLVFEAQRLGTYVVQRSGSEETTCIQVNAVPVTTSEPPPMPSTIPPRATAFAVRIETPVDYPPEATREMQRQAARVERLLLQKMGYPAKKRLRSSPLVSSADHLKLGKEQLPSGGAYDIAEKVFGEVAPEQDQRLRKVVKSRRDKMKKRLIKPYKD